MKRACLFITCLTLACGPSPAMAAGRPKDGRYSGEIGPGYPMNFRVSANGTLITGLVLGYEATCQPGAGSVAPLFHFATLRIKGGKFSGASTDHFGKGDMDALKISGTFNGHKVAGRVSSAASIRSLGTCRESEPFTAGPK